MEIPTTGVHHITLVGSNRQDTIDFYEGVLGMPFVFEQPNLDVPEETHLYFDPGDGRLITFFVRETRHHTKDDRAARRVGGIELPGTPDLGRPDHGRTEARRHHADDLVRQAAEHDAGTEDVRVAAELPLP